ncbi:protein Star-like isoform X2 [Daphnia carinata]|uniref:protein Star-like isoform X2 n=1 Tax=Daphnia carinata TaxID=120202 RepID=UPI00257C93E9|nr:protein Star-like isoform X2 [Daphnia carinata]
MAENGTRIKMLYYVNAHKLQQDHPCVIQLIRRDYLHPPASKSLAYQMDHPDSVDPSDGQSKVILKILQNKRRGFFIEAGGYDGEFLSNTLFMERSLQWSGLLIEADKTAYSKLLKRNRKAFSSPVCLSTKPYAMEVIYNGSISSGSFIIDQKENDGLAPNDGGSAATNSDSEGIYTAQCFPLYSLLLAVGRTHVDYFSLDVEGSEYKILKTIPWHKVYMQTLTVEWNHAPEGEAAVTRLMEDSNFIRFGSFSMPYSREVVYVQDFLYGYRIFGDPVA